MKNYTNLVLTSHCTIAAITILFLAPCDLHTAATTTFAAQISAEALQRALNQIIAGPVDETIRSVRGNDPLRSLLTAPSISPEVMTNMILDALDTFPATQQSIKVIQEATPEQLQNLLRNKKLTAFENLQHLTPEQLQLLAFDPSTYFPRRALKILAPKMTVEDLNNLLIKNHAGLLANYQQLSAQQRKQYNDECNFTILSNLPQAEFQNLPIKSLAYVSSNVLNKLSQKVYVLTPEKRTAIRKYRLEQRQRYQKRHALQNETRQEKAQRMASRSKNKNAEEREVNDRFSQVYVDNSPLPARTKRATFDEESLVTIMHDPKKMSVPKNRFIRRAVMPTSSNMRQIRLLPVPKNLDAPEMTTEHAEAQEPR